MSQSNQFGYRRTAAPRQAAVITPDNILKRPAAHKPLPPSTLQETLMNAQSAAASAQVSERGESKRPISFSRRPANRIERADAQLSADKLRSASVVKNASKNDKPKKPSTIQPRKWIGGFFDFIAKHYKGIAIILGGAVVMAAGHEVQTQNNDKRARLNNEPLATLTPVSEHEAAVEAVRNMVPSPSKQMKNGMNTAFNNWKGSISEITGDADIDPWSTKDGSRPDKSFHVTGQFAGTTGPNIDNTLIHGGGNLEKKTYHDKTINTEDQARILEVVNLNERVSDLPKAAYQKSPTEARLDTSKRDKAAREAARKAAAEKMAQQKLAQRGK